MFSLQPFLDVTRMSISTFSFLTQLDSGILPIECFPLTYDLNGCNSRINRHILTVGCFLTNFLCALIFYTYFSCNSMPCNGCSILHGVNLNRSKILK